MRRWLVSFLVVLMGVASGCATTDGGSLAKVVETGKLRVGMSGEQPPLTMVAKSGELLGLDVALSKVLAKSMGVEPVLMRLPQRETRMLRRRGWIERLFSSTRR